MKDIQQVETFRPSLAPKTVRISINSKRLTSSPEAYNVLLSHRDPVKQEKQRMLKE
jgi:hypothetical protein